MGVVLRVGSNFLLDPTMDTSPKPHLQKIVAMLASTSYFETCVKWQVPTPMLSTVVIARMDLKWLGTHVNRPLITNNWMENKDQAFAPTSPTESISSYFLHALIKTSRGRSPTYFTKSKHGMSPTSPFWAWGYNKANKDIFLVAKATCIQPRINIYHIS